jgi:hypothetical protein
MQITRWNNTDIICACYNMQVIFFQMITQWNNDDNIFSKIITDGNTNIVYTHSRAERLGKRSAGNKKDNKRQ